MLQGRTCRTAQLPSQTSAACLLLPSLPRRYSRGGLLESAFYMQVANALLPPLGEQPGMAPRTRRVVLSPVLQLRAGG